MTPLHDLVCRVNLDRSGLHMNHSLSYKFNKDVQRGNQANTAINIMDDDDDDDDVKSDNDFWNLENHDFDDKSKSFNPVKNGQNDSKDKRTKYNNSNNLNTSFLVASRKCLSKCRSYSSDSGVSSPFTVKSSSSPPPPPISSSPPTSSPPHPVEHETKHFQHSIFASSINDKININNTILPIASNDDVEMSVNVAMPF